MKEGVRIMYSPVLTHTGFQVWPDWARLDAPFKQIEKDTYKQFIVPSINNTLDRYSTCLPYLD